MNLYLIEYLMLLYLSDIFDKILTIHKPSIEYKTLFSLLQFKLLQFTHVLIWYLLDSFDNSICKKVTRYNSIKSYLLYTINTMPTVLLCF